MNKKILIGSIIAVVILILVTTPTVVGSDVNNQPPSATIINPRESYFHFLGVPLFPTFSTNTVTLGGFRLKLIQVNATDSNFPSKSLVVCFYINNKIRGVSHWNPRTEYHEWLWFGRAFGMYNLKVQAQNPYGLVSDYISLDVWSFC